MHPVLSLRLQALLSEAPSAVRVPLPASFGGVISSVVRTYSSDAGCSRRSENSYQASSFLFPRYRDNLSLLQWVMSRYLPPPSGWCHIRLHWGQMKTCDKCLIAVTRQNDSFEKWWPKWVSSLFLPGLELQPLLSQARPFCVPPLHSWLIPRQCQAYPGREPPRAFWVPSGMLRNPHHSQEQCTQKELGPLSCLERAVFTDIHEASLKAKSKWYKPEG